MERCHSCTAIARRTHAIAKDYENTPGHSDGLTVYVTPDRDLGGDGT